MNKADLIIFDEFTMVSYKHMMLLDKQLKSYAQSIAKQKEPFGDKAIIFVGDHLQLSG